MDPPEISLILRELNLNADCIANIYSHGSWLQGTCTPKSDRDLIIVTRSYQQTLSFRSDFDYFHQFELHKLFNKYDVCVYSVENFEESLKHNYLLCVQCIFLPDEFKIKEEIDFRTTYLDKFYDPMRIKKVAFYELLSSLNMLDPTKYPNSPKRSLTENETIQSRKDYIFKNLFHGIRFLDIAEQLIQTRSIRSFTRTSYILNTMKDLRGDPTDESNMERVVEFVHTKSDEFKSKLDTLLPTNIIKGTFEVHTTFDCKSNSERVIEQLKQKCQHTKYKIAFIHLYADPMKNKIQQLIVISSYHGEYPSIVKEIEEEIHKYFQDFTIAGIKIKSLASNEGIPKTDIDKQLFWSERTYYFEFHCRVLLKQEYDENFFKMIQNKCKSNSEFNPLTGDFWMNKDRGRWGRTDRKKVAHLWTAAHQKVNLCISPYVVKRMDHKKFHYMIKMCLFDIGREKAFEMNNELVKYLQRTLCTPSKIERQFVVYNTNIDLTKVEDS